MSQPPPSCPAHTLDPANNMPSIPDQSPSPSQSTPLPTQRVPSTIPKNTQDVWIYPSEQMFYNAVTRKHGNGKAEERDMGVIVQIHNAVNEQCWQHVLQWERYYDEPCQSPSLVRFQGKPGTPSPKSRILRLLGYQAPFDRHDWVVERCGATVVYVIDFYAGKQQEDKASFYLDVRPRLRDGGWWVRLKRLWHDRMY